MYVFMDIEATGQVPSEAFQVAMVIANNQFEVQEILNFYVEHDLEIMEHVLELCHLKKSDLMKIEQLAYTRREAVEVVERVMAQYQEEVTFIGKMIKGDIKWLRKIGVCCGQIEFMENCKYIEINHFFEENHKLMEDCLTYGITYAKVLDEVKRLLEQGKLRYGTEQLFGGDYHNALIDAYATYSLVEELVVQKKLDLESATQVYDWSNRSYLMMNRRAMEDAIAVKIYQNQLFKEIKEEYGITIPNQKLRVLDTITFENGCVMGVTKKEILLGSYLPQLRQKNERLFSRYEVRVKRGRQIRKITIIALNRFDLFVQLNKMMAPHHVPKSFEKRSVLVGLLKNPCAYLEANGYTLLSIKLKETNIEYRIVS